MRIPARSPKDMAMIKWFHLPLSCRQGQDYIFGCSIFCIRWDLDIIKDRHLEKKTPFFQIHPVSAGTYQCRRHSRTVADGIYSERLSVKPSVDAHRIPRASNGGTVNDPLSVNGDHLCSRRFQLIDNDQKIQIMDQNIIWVSQGSNLWSRPR